MHVQFRVSEYHHFGRIVDARGDLPRLSALLAPRRPLPLLQSTLIGHYIALARHPRIAPVRNSKLFLFTSFYCGTTGTVVVAIECHYWATPPPPVFFLLSMLVFPFFLIPAVFFPFIWRFFFFSFLFISFLSFRITVDRILWGLNRHQNWLTRPSKRGSSLLTGIKIFTRFKKLRDEEHSGHFAWEKLKL